MKVLQLTAYVHRPIIYIRPIRPSGLQSQNSQRWQISPDILIFYNVSQDALSNPNLRRLISFNGRNQSWNWAVAQFIVHWYWLTLILIHWYWHCTDTVTDIVVINCHYHFSTVLDVYLFFINGWPFCAHAASNTERSSSNYYIYYIYINI